VEQVSGVDGEFDAHREREQTDSAHHVFTQSFGQAIAKHSAENTTDEHRRGAEECPGEGGHEGP